MSYTCRPCVKDSHFYALNSETGKPVKPEELRKIEGIVNEQIKAEMDVYSKEAKLAEAKRVNGLRAVFGEVSFMFVFIVCWNQIRHVVLFSNLFL